MFLLPGLTVALLGFVLARLLGRWFEPVPARAWWLVAGLLAALFAPVLLGGRILLPVDRLDRVVPYRPLDPQLLAVAESNPIQLDLVTQITPWRAAVRREIADGRWPLWNPHAGAGTPLLANPQAQIFQPLTVAALPLPLPQAAAVTAALRVLVAFVFFFLFAHRQGLGEPAALTGATAYGLSGFLLHYLGWPLANQAALLPLMLYAVVSWADRRRRADLLLLATAFFAVLHGGHPETIVYVLLTAAALALTRIARTVAQARRSPDATTATRPPWTRDLSHLLGGWLLAALLAGLAAAPALLATLHYLPQTERFQLTEDPTRPRQHQGSLARWSDPDERRQLLEDTERRLIPVVAPLAQGSRVWGDYWGDRNVNAAAGGFAGTFALLAALVGLVARRRSPVRVEGELLMAGLGALALVAVVRFPGYEELVSALPLLGRSASLHRRLLMLLAFAVAFLAAVGVERLLRHGLPRRTVAGIAAGLGAAVVVATLVGAKPADPGALASVRFGYLGLQLAVLAAGALALASGTGRPRRRGVAWAVVALVAVELLAFHRPVNRGVPAPLFYPETESLQVLAERLDGSPYRMVALGPALPPEMATLHGLSDIRSHGPTRPGAVRRLLSPLFIPSPVLTKVHPWDHPRYDLLAVRYVLAPPRYPGPDPGSGLVPVPLDHRRSGVLWERPSALPLAFLPLAATEVDGRRAWWLQIPHSPGERSLVESLPGEARRWRAARPDASGLELTRLESELLQARALLVEPRLIATSLYQDGGWHLLADSADRSDRGALPTLRANGPLVAGWLPAGDLSVTLLYRPPGFFWGALLAALAIAGGAAVAQRPPEPRPRPEGASPAAPARRSD